jgi:Rho-binding antiterminator
MTKNISCDAHDYFEIVCMRRSQIKVTAKDNKKYLGTAIDIKLVERQEYLLISNANNIQQILLSEVKQLEAIGNSVAEHNFLISW